MRREIPYSAKHCKSSVLLRRETPVSFICWHKYSEKYVVFGNVHLNSYTHDLHKYAIKMITNKTVDLSSYSLNMVFMIWLKKLEILKNISSSYHMVVFQKKPAEVLH